MEDLLDAAPADHVEQKARDLDAAAKIVLGDAPKAESPPDGRVTLLFGAWNGSSYDTDAEVRELTGRDEEALARFTNPVDLFDAILCRGTVRIGSNMIGEADMGARQNALAGLIVGDRERLFLHIVAATYGDKRAFPFGCPHCEASAEVDIYLTKDFKPTSDEEPRPTYETITSKGDKITYRLTNGFDQLLLARKKGLNSAEMNTTILSECIMLIDGEPPFDPVGYVRDLSMKDRQDLLTELAERQPNMDTVFTFDCPSCGSEVNLQVDWGDIFRL